MRGAETLCELPVEGACIIVEHEPVERDMHLEILPFIACIDAEKRPAICLGHMLAVENIGRQTRQLGKGGGDFGPGFRAGRRDPSLCQIEAQIGVQDAART